MNSIQTQTRYVSTDQPDLSVRRYESALLQNFAHGSLVKGLVGIVGDDGARPLGERVFWSVEEAGRRVGFWFVVFGG